MKHDSCSGNTTATATVVAQTQLFIQMLHSNGWLLLLLLPATRRHGNHSTSGLVDDVMFAHYSRNRRRTSDSVGSSMDYQRGIYSLTHQGAAPGAESEIYDCLVAFAVGQNKLPNAQESAV